LKDSLKVESTPNASGAIFRLAEAAALRKEGASLQDQRIGGMVSGKPNTAKAAESVADQNIHLASQASGRERKTKIPREMVICRMLSAACDTKRAVAAYKFGVRGHALARYFFLPCDLIGTHRHLITSGS
jgi:hypothetical protein